MPLHERMDLEEDHVADLEPVCQRDGQWDASDGEEEARMYIETDGDPGPDENLDDNDDDVLLVLEEPDTAAPEESEPEPTDLAAGLEQVAFGIPDQGSTGDGSSSSSSKSTSTTSDSSSTDTETGPAEPQPAASSQAPATENAVQRAVSAAAREDARETHDALTVRKEERGATVGFIKHQPQQSAFYAKCPRHGARCVKTQTYKITRRPGSGRPLGYLAGWLHIADQHESKESHMKAIVDYEIRLKAREILAKEVNALEFFDLERGVAPDEEGLEPRIVPQP